MAPEEWTADPAVDATDQWPLKQRAPLAQILHDAGYRFDFFQAVRLLERIYPRHSPVGRHIPPNMEVVRFRSHVSMAFPASQIREVRKAEASRPGPPAEMEVCFMGLAGLAGSLPPYFTEALTNPRESEESAPLAAFLDLFNHRLISLFYRAWEKYRFPIAYERGGEDTFSAYLFSLIGMGTNGLRGRLRVNDQILLHYAGLLAQRPRSAVALEGMLQDYFDVPVEVVQFQGAWFSMGPENLTSLGVDGANSRLGLDAVLWARIWDPQARFRIRVGPLSHAEFKRFLPTGSAWRHLVELTRFFVGEEFNFDVQLRLKAEEVPWCVLGESGETRLGWSMWLKTREFDDDTSQPILAMRVAEQEPGS